MTTHNTLATTSNMVFDEIFTPGGVECCLVPQAVFDCGNCDDQTAPTAATMSTCSSGELSSAAASAASPAAADYVSVTGGREDIEEKYTIDPRILGSGHQGSVRECFDRATGERFAVKSIRKAAPDIRPSGIAREISLLREVDHDGIVRLRDAYEDAEYVHLVTDLCTGGELFDRIVERTESDDRGAPCLEEGEAARILHQILTAVSHMHERGIAHRDIKPENVLFQTDEADSPIKVIDFGLARGHFDGIEPPMSSVVGTPYYIAPEVLRRSYDKSCDLWSVGVVAYTMLCGYPPFNGPDRARIRSAVLRGAYSFPREEWGGISWEARDFVRRLLRVQTRERMTASEALEHPWIVGHAATAGSAASDDSVRVSSRECPPDELVCDWPRRSPEKSSVRSSRRRRMRKAVFGK